MKIVAMSDLHGDLVDPGIVEGCDVVCICGDFVPLRMQRNVRQSLKWLRQEFMKWCEALPCERVLVVSGNHDFAFDVDAQTAAGVQYGELTDIFEDNEKVILMDNRVYEYQGKKFWGCPYTTGPANWANYRPDNTNPYSLMPEDMDVILVHQPPHGAVGLVHQSASWNYLTNYGSISMVGELNRANAKYLFCGHIHSGSHQEEIIGGTKCYNVSIKDENYNISYLPLYIEI